MPSFLQAPLQAKLEHVELVYRNGKSNGVNEDDLINFHNEIVTKIGAPDWARIDRAQFDAMRGYLSVYEPNFIGKSTPNGAEFNRQLSPLQAAHMFGNIMEQKLTEPYWQVPPGTPFPKYDPANPRQHDNGFVRAVR